MDCGIYGLVYGIHEMSYRVHCIAYGMAYRFHEMEHGLYEIKYRPYKMEVHGVLYSFIYKLIFIL